MTRWRGGWVVALALIGCAGEPTRPAQPGDGIGLRIVGADTGPVMVSAQVRLGAAQVVVTGAVERRRTGDRRSPSPLSGHIDLSVYRPDGGTDALSLPLIPDGHYFRYWGFRWTVPERLPPGTLIQLCFHGTADTDRPGDSCLPSPPGPPAARRERRFTQEDSV